jgi:hypothetical protein
MALTTEQKATLKAAILADPVLNAHPNSLDGAFAIALEVNKFPTPDFLVWMTNTPVQDVIDAVDGSRYTPSDAIPTTTIELSQIYQSRILACQTKQISFQTLVIGRDFINSSKANIRAWLRDSVIQVPAGANGAVLSPGGSSGVTALTACLRKARIIEKLLSTGSATTGTVTGNLLGFEGSISPQDVEAARGS